MRNALTASLAVFCIAVGMTAPLYARENEPHPSYVDDYMKFVPLQLSDGRLATVDRVFLNVGGQVQAADPGRGVIRDNQNRLDWGSLPLVGKRAKPRYNESEFRPETALGEAYYEDRTVWLDLSDEPPGAQYFRIEFLNQDYAYSLNAGSVPSDAARVPPRPPGSEIGKIYRGENGALLVLVRPFIVTDTLF